MNTKNKNYLSLVMWVVALILTGSVIGSLTKPEINTLYNILNRSPLTPPNYVFPVAWTILYTIIATCGWIIWCSQWFPALRFIKGLYVIQLILNWSWTALFFRYQLTGFSLIDLVVMDIAVAIIIYLAYVRIRAVSLLMIPYLLWILFATHLNFYIWQYN
jgi:tryptophan-rich sensory protein